MIFLLFCAFQILVGALNPATTSFIHGIKYLSRRRLDCSHYKQTGLKWVDGHGCGLGSGKDGNVMYKSQQRVKSASFTGSKPRCPKTLECEDKLGKGGERKCKKVSQKWYTGIGCRTNKYKKPDDLKQLFGKDASKRKYYGTMLETDGKGYRKQVAVGSHDEVWGTMLGPH